MRGCILNCLCYRPYLISMLLLSVHLLTLVLLMFFILVIESADSIYRDSADTNIC